MSLAQQHAGLILVPWFNSLEWRYVYESVYSKDREKQLKALELLKIWKLRTPILSSGVEGTLILLDALLMDTASLSIEQISNLYSIALMRFLNLSAANSEKQGFFGKTSAKNELPKWLINLRHDIAHGHQIPSLYNLKMGLDFGFRWLKEKYWEPQSKIIKDYYVGEDSGHDNHLVNSLNAYIDINIALFENQDLDNEYVESIKQTILKKFKMTVAHPYLMLDILLEMITQSLEKDRLRREISLDQLVSTKALLKPNIEALIEDEEGNERLDKKFRNIWQKLLNIFHQYGLLFEVINRLFDVVGDMSRSENCKKMAAMWINELFVSLNSLKGLEMIEDDVLELQLNKYTYSKETTAFQQHVLHCSNKYSVYFLDNVLKYNLNNNQFNQDVLNLVHARSSAKNLNLGVQNIFTLEDLSVKNLSLDDIIIKTFNGKENGISSLNDTAQIVGTSKWKKIEDTSIFKNCPLGILPHQIGQKHPFLALG